MCTNIEKKENIRKLIKELDGALNSFCQGFDVAYSPQVFSIPLDKLESLNPSDKNDMLEYLESLGGEDSKECLDATSFNVPEELREILCFQKGKNYIYTFHASSRGEAIAVRNECEAFKETNREIDLPQINRDAQGKTIYVGSSVSDLNARILKHLGFGPDKGYGLHFYKWIKECYFDVVLTVYEVDDSDNDLVQFIEDKLWDIHSPVLGKKGKR